MNLSVKILLNSEKPVIPYDYRRSMVFFIKEAIHYSKSGNESIKKYFFEESGKAEPFKFTVSFKAAEKQNDKGIVYLSEPWIKLHFFTDDPAFLKCFCDGLIRLPKDYPLFPQLKAKIGPFYCQECRQLRCTGCKLKVTIGSVELPPEY